MRERWREMPRIYGGQDDPFGRVQIGKRIWDIPRFVLDEEGARRVRNGYVCISCYERHPVPMPEFCADENCRFPIRAHQQEVFDHYIERVFHVGPSTTDAEEWEWAKEEVARLKHQPGSSIWIPDNAKVH